MVRWVVVRPCVARWVMVRCATVEMGVVTDSQYGEIRWIVAEVSGF